MPGRRGYLMAESMHRAELWREGELRRKAAPILPTLTDKQRAFVRLYVEQGKRNGERAALRAGYGVASAANGGRSAAVSASRLLKRADIQKAIREVVSERAERLRRDQTMLAALESELERRALRRIVAGIADELEPVGRMRGPQSKAARLARRYRGQTMLRLPGRCRCGEQSDPGTASCAPCRRERRHYRRRYRANRRPLRAA